MKKLTIIFVSLCMLATHLASQENATEKSPWNFSLVTDFAYYPRADFIKSGDATSHFAPTTGAYSGIEFRITGNASYTIPIPFGENPLVKGNTLVFNSALELSPVSIMPKFSITFTPIAFLVFTAGGNFGTGWFMPGLNVQGMSLLKDPMKEEMVDAYENLTPFKHFYVDAFIDGTFQFDVAALWPGDWHHIVTLANFTAHYITLTGVPNGAVWGWQGTANQANGWQYNAQFVLGYQMPRLPLSMVALNCELSGHFRADDYDQSKYKNYNGSYMTVDMAPLMQFSFAKHHSLLVAFYFERRRSFVEAHTSNIREPILTQKGNEWYFRRIALSYTYTF